MTEIDKKIEELVLSFTPKVYCFFGSGVLTNTYDENVALQNARECALIAVEHILNNGRLCDNMHHNDFYDYKEMKAKLEKLTK